MNKHIFLRVWAIVAGILFVGTIIAASGWGLRVAWGVGLGGLWNLANIWCLAQLVNAWLGSQTSRRRVLQWLFVKCALLYILVVGLLQHPDISLIGFGVGFTVVLMGTVIVLALRAQHLFVPLSHDR